MEYLIPPCHVGSMHDQINYICYIFVLHFVDLHSRYSFLSSPVLELLRCFFLLEKGAQCLIFSLSSFF